MRFQRRFAPHHHQSRLRHEHTRNESTGRVGRETAFRNPPPPLCSASAYRDPTIMTASPYAPLLTVCNEELARDYDRISVDRQLQSGKSLVERLAIAPGEHVLDVGCGTGLPALHIAGLVGAAGSVLGIDPLPLRIALAQARARPGLEFRVGDAYRLD